MSNNFRDAHTKLTKKQEKFKLLDDAKQEGLTELAKARAGIEMESLEPHEVASIELDYGDKVAHLIARIAEMKAATL